MQKIQTLLVDDIDGSEAEGTVRFGLDGAEYEIDPGLWSFSLSETQDGDRPCRVTCRPSPSGRGAGETG
jgi:hypothetical protein